MKPVDLALAVGATLRLTRFVTSDLLGEWTIARPARRWANEREHLLTPEERRNLRDTDLGTFTVDPDNGWRSKLVKGLSCPFCVGFWIGAAVLGATALTSNPKRLRLERARRLAFGALALNYLTGHVGKRLD